eukprot:TRINITY_DN34366_c0_g1_i1.p1 TRINITY_DN34366_c0_g1~~TRINITY_DN34366_c0_g1_i1.p1  ORF type:complete len:839 (+),score=136.21 TRINITY_DN34366_c0_g1_i1:120-2636(+)
MLLSLNSIIVFVLSFHRGVAEVADAGGLYVSVERSDAKRVVMRVSGDSDLPSADDEVMLDQLEQWKWRVEIAVAGSATLVTFSQCPHGLGLLPNTLGWRSGGRWRPWPGTFEYSKGAIVNSPGNVWGSIHESRACQGSPEITQLGDALVPVEFDGCQEACARRKDCNAIDYYKKTKWCVLYDKPCAQQTHGHDGASSWRLSRGVSSKNALHSEVLTFMAAKTFCNRVDNCSGFSYTEAWSDKEKADGVPRLMLFFGADVALTSRQNQGHSYLRKDNPRANCNPEGVGFDCPANPYACLGLSIDADTSAIKQAYRSLSRKLHPDKVKVSMRTPEAIKQAEVAFREIADSHEILSSSKRRDADRKLMMARRRWEKERQSVQDIYIKETRVTSLEPESYPLLVPQAQEWLIHYFLPENGECKQMKMALVRAAEQLGTGEEERGLRDPPSPARRPYFAKGDVLRGFLRERSIALRSSGAGRQDGDVQIVVIVQTDFKQPANSATGTLFGLEEEVTVSIARAVRDTTDNRPAFTLTGGGRTYTGRFDEQDMTFRGTITENEKPKHEIASFALVSDVWQPPQALNASTRAGAGGVRQKPRLFGAVNCGRFGAFCKRKGIDPAVEKRFPHVRMIFPEEVRYELYRGAPIGRELIAFAREASRSRSTVRELNIPVLKELAKEPERVWLVLLQKEPTSNKAALDCALCKTALPMLKRTAARFEEAGVGVGWINCSDLVGTGATACNQLGGPAAAGPGDVTGTSVTAEWGELRLLRLGGASMERAWPPPSTGLWDSTLVPLNEMTRTGLLTALETAASMSNILAGSREGARGQQVTTGGESVLHKAEL